MSVREMRASKDASTSVSAWLDRCRAIIMGEVQEAFYNRQGRRGDAIFVVAIGIFDCVRRSDAHFGVAARGTADGRAAVWRTASRCWATASAAARAGERADSHTA
jgi:hypothetical protein